MRYPLDSIVITGAYKEVAQPGTGLADSSGVRRHIGTDLRASVGTNVYAPGAGVVTASYSGTAGNTLEVRIAGKLWRFMHLSERLLSVGQTFSEGQVIAKSGNSGGVAAHLHVDCRKDGTSWNASLNNYYDPLEVIRVSLKSNREVAQEVLDGKWGNGSDRKTRLAQAGYDYNAIQVEVNNILNEKVKAAEEARLAEEARVKAEAEAKKKAEEAARAEADRLEAERIAAEKAAQEAAEQAKQPEPTPTPVEPENPVTPPENQPDDKYNPPGVIEPAIVTLLKFITSLLKKLIGKR